MPFKYQPQWQGPLSGRSFEKQTEDFLNGIESRVDEIDRRQTPSDATPMPPGAGSAGTALEYSRGDHSHPLQTSVSGSAGSAGRLSTPREISMAGEGSGMAAFDGSANISIPLTVACTATGSTEHRAIADRFADAVNALDFGAAGDGIVDDTAAITAAATYAVSQERPLFLPGVHLVSQLVLPAGTRIVGDAVFKDAGFGAQNDCIITFLEDCSACLIELQMVYNGSQRYGIRLRDSCSVNRIKVWGESEVNSLAVQLAGDNVSVGFLETKMISRGGLIGADNDIVSSGGVPTGATADGRERYSGISLGGYYLESVVQGLRVGRCAHSVLGPGYVRGLPETMLWAPNPGYNGLLVMSAADVVIGDVEMDLILEHGIRLAGDFMGAGGQTVPPHDIHFGRIISSRHGGSALKINPSNAATPVYNVTADCIISIDAGNRAHANTRRLSTLRLSHCKGVRVGDVVSKVTDPSFVPVETDFMDTDVVEICNASDVSIASITADKCSRSLVCFNETNDSDGVTPASSLSCNDINISGVVCSDSYATSGFYTARFYCTDMAVSDVTIKGVDCGGAKFLGYVRSGDDGITTNVAKCYMHVFDKEGKAAVSDTISQQVEIDSVSVFGGTNIVHSASAATLETDAVASAGILLKTKSDTATSGSAGSIVFTRRAGSNRPSGAIVGYQFDGGSAGRCGLALATGDGTTASNALLPRWGIRYDNGGALVPMADNSTNLGGASNRIKEIFCGNAAINTSDSRDKSNISAPTEALFRAWEKVNFAEFQFKDAVEKKGAENARLHVGVIAQEVQAAFASEGLDAARYGLFCHDTWSEHVVQRKVVDVPEELGSEGNVIQEEVSHVETETVPAGDRYGIRYSEALTLECAYQRWRADKMEARIAALENKETTA